jgi:hypothetical protein
VLNVKPELNKILEKEVLVSSSKQTVVVLERYPKKIIKSKHSLQINNVKVEVRDYNSFSKTLQAFEKMVRAFKKQGYKC